mgnify:CR=1 FL=1
MASSSGKGTKVPYRCSFCGKSQEQVRKLIAGQGVYICDECIELCNEIIEEDLGESSSVSLENLPNPREVREFLERDLGPEGLARSVVVVVTRRRWWWWWVLRHLFGIQMNRRRCRCTMKE